MNSIQLISFLIHLSPLFIFAGVLLYVRYVLDDITHKLHDSQRVAETITKDLKIAQHIKDYL